MLFGLSVEPAKKEVYCGVATFIKSTLSHETVADSISIRSIGFQGTRARNIELDTIVL